MGLLPQVEILQKDVEEKGLKVISLSSLLDESAMNAHLKMLSDQASELRLQVQTLEEEKAERLNEVGQLQEALNQSEQERAVVSEQLGAVQEALKNAESSVQGKLISYQTSVHNATYDLKIQFDCNFLSVSMYKLYIEEHHVYRHPWCFTASVLQN